LIATWDKDGYSHGAKESLLISLNVSSQKEELLLVLKKNSNIVVMFIHSPLFAVSLLNRNQSEVIKHFSMNREILNSRDFLI
jgi:hypothetical protein